MTETECQVGIACHNKGVNTPDMAETRPGQIWVFSFENAESVQWSVYLQ